MFRSKVSSLILAVALIGMLFVSVADTQAGWWHRGWGCCGYPAYGGWYAPVGWGYSYPYAYGYGCGYGCGWRTAYWGGCYSGCYSGCYNPCYCSSCYSYSYPCCTSTTVTPSAPATESKQTPTPAPMPNPNLNAPQPQLNTPASPSSSPSTPGSTDSQTRATVSPDAGMLTIQVPEDAAVFINGYRTKSTGATRQYISNGLKAGLSYKYEIRAEMVRDGRLVEDNQVVYLTAGNTQSVAFSFNSNPQERLATIW